MGGLIFSETKGGGVERDGRKGEIGEKDWMERCEGGEIVIGLIINFKRNNISLNKNYKLYQGTN